MQNFLVGGASFGPLEIMALEAGGRAVGVAGGLQHGGAGRAEPETGVEGPVQGHGFPQGQIEHGVAAVAAPGRAGHLGGKLRAHPFEQLISPGGQGFVIAKNNVQFRVRHEKIQNVKRLECALNGFGRARRVRKAGPEWEGQALKNAAGWWKDASDGT